ncbi:hypothetical protein [Rhizobium tumorigenes]|uniref:Uncharacterized protein n=1 Tax=Rhizobium tumorigenes TaxID=2041385 RepID=A0AAF1KAJ1_9HYPH|nr:hypothetical protein [Rhizobium tumorigenes]WFR98705.1 hypothetical protein PR017_23685 [Rhizobium tumorigenes]
MTLNFRLKSRGDAAELTAANHLPQPPTAEQIREREIAIERSMLELLDLLSPTIAGDAHDAAMIALGASAAVFVEPLSRHEVQTLGCALYMEKRGSAFTYHDILRLTDRFSGKAMNLTMVYRTIERLIDRGMLVQEDVVTDESERSRRYVIHGLGREAFRMAVLNSKVLAKAKSYAAA